MLNEHLLKRVQIAIAFQPFNRGDSMTVVHRREGHARQNSPTFDMDSARSAFAAVTGLLGTSQAQLITQCIEERGAWLDS
jgi:hypothetical protein